MKVNPIKKSSIASMVFEAIHEMIATGKLKSGDKLPPQEELARQFGVSRNTLREALNRLSAIGLIKFHQGMGTVIEHPSPETYLGGLEYQFLLDTISVREFIEARIGIERITVRLAVQRSVGEDFKILNGILEKQRKAVNNADPEEFTLQDALFHLTLSRISGNRVLLKFIQTIQDMLKRFIREVSILPGAMENALGFHRLITEAIVSKNSSLAEFQMVSHIFDVVRRIESNIGIDLEKESLCGFELLGSQKEK